MRHNLFFLKMELVSVVILLTVVGAAAQTVTSVFATKQADDRWRLQIVFNARVEQNKIKDVKLFDPDFAPDLNNPQANALVPLGVLTRTVVPNVYEVLTTVGLKTTAENKIKAYILNIKVEDADGNTDWQSIRVTEPASLPRSTVTISKASDIDEADVYVDGQIEGARKEKTSFSTNIKLQKTTKRGDWKYTPYGFFKLNASTKPDADPDSMEFGFNFRYMFEKPIDWDNEAKIESERDFGNTNLIYASRFIYMRAGDKIADITQPNGKKRPVQVFFRPYIGAELGKNLRSPLDAAEGDRIARILAGVNLRLNVPINREKGRDINWTNSYARRWLLSDELGFEADDNGNLQLTHFGKSPRDYFKSNVDYSFNKFFGFFVEHEWGQLPPSYKKVNHSFRVGFSYKFKFGIE